MPTINGTAGNDFVHMAGDGLVPPAGFNEIAEATDGFDYYYGELGGNDRVYLGAGTDYFYFDGGFNANDRLDGGADYDYLYLYRPQTVNFSNVTIRNIETIYLYGTFGPGTFDFTFHNANLGAGNPFSISGSDLESDNPMRIDFSAETDAAYIYIYGGAGNDTVIGSAVSDYMYGYGGNDSLVGGPGNDNLYGYGGLDTLVGGPGSDYYYYAGGDVVIEEADGGYDYFYAYGDGTLPANVEYLGLQGDLPSSGTGNDGDNTISGSEGSNHLRGLGGLDNLYGQYANDLLEGDGDADTLYGGHGDDTLFGGGGADYMSGGPGNDTYVNPTGDSFYEGLRQGTDTVESNATFSLEIYANVENLSLTGTSPIDGTGNELANRIIGNASRNRLAGNDGEDTLRGGNGHDTLIGGNGSDDLAGENGNDSLAGGEGNDTINGGKGNDTMSGSAGSDLFRFAVSGTGSDTINGFSTMQDLFDLSGGTFSLRTVDGADTVLTHAGGTIRVVGVTGLNLNQWNELVVPGPASTSVGHALAVDAAEADAAIASRAQSGIRAADGDWLFA